jgi:anti-anti-sigma factor
MSGLAGPAPGLEGHVGLVYRSPAVRDEWLAEFVGTGLQRGEQVLLMAGADDRTWQAGLASRGVDTADAAREGSLAVVDPPGFYPAQGQAALVDRMLDTGRPGLRLVAHAEVALGYLGEAGYRRVEQEMEHLCATRPVTLLCQLQADSTLAAKSGSMLPAVIEEHRDALHGPGVTVRRDSGGVRLSGELDLASGGLVEAVLRRAARDGPGGGAPAAEGIVVDLSGLEFLDVAGFRALLRGTEQWRRRGGVMVLTGVHGTARRVIDILGGRDRSDVILR